MLSPLVTAGLIFTVSKIEPKMANFSCPCVLNTLADGVPLEFCNAGLGQKVYQAEKKSLMISLTVSIQ